MATARSESASRGAGDDVRHVLLVEDDALQGEAVRDFLERHGLEVSCARDADAARTLLERLSFDVVVLDRMLNRRDALGLVAEIADRYGVPVIVASAHGDEVDRVLGLERGADDYLTKPYSFRELLARIRVLHRRRRAVRTTLEAARVACFGGWTLDQAAHRIAHDSGAIVDLSAGELAVLMALLEHPGRVLARHELLALTRKDNGEVFDRAIDVLISRLRRKLHVEPAAPIIRTIRNGGYQLAVGVEWR